MSKVYSVTFDSKSLSKLRHYIFFNLFHTRCPNFVQKLCLLWNNVFIKFSELTFHSFEVFLSHVNKTSNWFTSFLSIFFFIFASYSTIFKETLENNFYHIRQYKTLVNVQIIFFKLRYLLKFIILMNVMGHIGTQKSVCDPSYNVCTITVN